MIFMKTFAFFLTLALAVPLLHATPSAEEMVAKAREYLGGDAVLDRVTSVYYEGDFETGEGDTGTIKITFQRPLQQRIEVLRGDLGEVTALNDFDGWRMLYDLNDKSRWSMTLLDPPNIRELQANTWENLNFFKGIEARRGRVEAEGLVEVDEKQTMKLVFHHPRGIVFTRFFCVETGRLMMTQTNEGSEIREQGEVRVGGIVFPETLTMKRDGKVINRVRFREIRVNEKFEDSLFDIPSMAP